MILGFVNEKGGPGKTTLSLAIAFECALHGKKVLVVDADPQQSLLGWSQDRELPLPDNLSIISMPTKTIHREIHKLSLYGWDVIIIDGPPRATDITQSILLASDIAIVPCTASGFDIKATANIIDVIRQATEFNKKLKFAVVINRKVANTTISKDIRSGLTGIGEDVFVLNTEIGMRIIFAESASDGLSVQEVGTDKKAMKELNDLYLEIMEVENVRKQI